MTKSAYVIVGSGYGDEGKGLMTDCLVRKLTEKDRPPVNVRFNGGGQAGHTVVCKDGRHVFSHVGAGSFAHASTFLSSAFIVNPMVLERELKELKDKGVVPQIEVHPECAVTTVFDITLNMLRELSRGANRHGSCGLGVNETVTRHMAGFPLTVDDVYNNRPSEVREKLAYILKNWWQPRLAEIDLSNVKAEDIDSVMCSWDIEVVLNILLDCGTGLNWRNYAPTKNLSRKDMFVFEGAQGLELDEFMGEFPHVTRSQTGLQGALLAAAQIGVTNITPIYVTRAYKTRHGAGPLPHEGVPFCTKTIVDKTNVDGPWQGEFRYAPLDISRLHRAIHVDLMLSIQLAEKLRITINPPEIAVTCLDQVGETLIIQDGDIAKYVTHDELVNVLGTIAQVKYLSYGETAETIKEL